jgi:hypothetical protein
MREYVTSKEFERSVGELLTLGGYDVRGETLLGHKKVDLYVEERRLGSARRIAVECKLYGTLIGQDQLTRIYANYLPLVKDGKVDEVLLITDKGLSPSAQAMCLELRDLRHLTYSELECVIMDFSVYLRGLVDDYEQSGLSTYYVPLRSEAGNDLEDDIIHWVSQSDFTPVAILGSYGMGKTTFAKRIAWRLASEDPLTPSHRIPILLSLSEISSDQSLPGLLGKALTAQSVVRNYSYDLFMRLNRAGRFLIILDGFDEMKHCLTWDSFCYNFAQINRLVQGRSKVIVLGRPNAFLNEEEQQYILHGTWRRQGRVFRLEDWPNYSELRIGLLTSEQIRLFLWGYLAWRGRKKVSPVLGRLLKSIERAEEENVNSKLRDLAGRPVQLFMLAEILPQWSGPVDALSVPILYDIFIHNIIEREQRKLTRQSLTMVERRAFARDIAWWLWVEKSSSSLTAAQIPDALVLRYCREPDELEGRKRDLIAACFLSRKEGDALYFPHRSFQEFLVAERVIEELQGDRPQYGFIAQIVTEEIAFFVSNTIGVGDLVRWEPGLERYRGTLPWSLSRIWLVSPATTKWLVERVESSSNPWYPLFLTAGILKEKVGNTSPEILARRLVRRLELAPDPIYALLCFFCLSALAGLIPENLIERCLWMLAERRIVVKETRQARRRRRSESSEVFRLVKQREEVTEPVLDRFFDALEIDYKTSKILTGKAYSFVGMTLRGYCLLADWLEGERLNSDNLHLRGSIQVAPNTLASIKRRLEQYRDRSRQG